ncbi:MAG: DUF1579 domain-containing protein [Myxococcales bacterium]|jgi:hypothetical protein|nr:DUF1579 domain-containing protein [Myxococcales bacterium]MBK7191396.1 DUF1579 domain-containing protein [Myxococcales bacterium]MBP6844707.1 hypothetical protein [Kofleriaceae bacterium]
MPNDFDFLFGRWRVAHRRLDARLAGCTTWTEFAGTCATWPLLGGRGNIDDNVLELPSGTYRAATLRSYDAASAQWSIWWLDARDPHRLDPPVVGRFHEGRGRFECADTLDGRPIRVRFDWSVDDPAHPRWEQAFSPDGGATWEVNWQMRFTRDPADPRGDG